MEAIRKDFSLSEVNVGALRALCQHYGLDGGWLQWQYEKHVMFNGTSPFHTTTSKYAHSFKEGFDKIKFEIAFDHEHPNVVKWVQFDESPTNKTFVITQTSLMHTNEDNACVLWLELPKGALGPHLELDAAYSLLKAKLCCSEWKDSLPANPVTPLERAQLYTTQNDLTWTKKQLVMKDLIIARMNGTLGFQSIEISALTAEIDKLTIDVSKTKALKDQVDELKGEVKNETKAKNDAVDGLMRKVADGKQKLEKLEETIKSEKATNKELRKALKDDKAAVVELERKLVAMKKDLNKSQALVKSGHVTIAKLRGDIDEQELSELSGPESPTKKRKLQAAQRIRIHHTPTALVPATPQSAPAWDLASAMRTPTARTRPGCLAVAQGIQSPSDPRYHTPTHGYGTRGGGRAYTNDGFLGRGGGSSVESRLPASLAKPTGGVDSPIGVPSGSGGESAFSPAAFSPMNGSLVTSGADETASDDRDDDLFHDNQVAIYVD